MPSARRLSPPVRAREAAREPKETCPETLLNSRPIAARRSPTRFYIEKQATKSGLERGTADFETPPDVPPCVGESRLSHPVRARGLAST